MNWSKLLYSRGFFLTLLVGANFLIHLGGYLILTSFDVFFGLEVLYLAFLPALFFNIFLISGLFREKLKLIALWWVLLLGIIYAIKIIVFPMLLAGRWYSVLDVFASYFLLSLALLVVWSADSSLKLGWFRINLVFLLLAFGVGLSCVLLSFSGLGSVYIASLSLLLCYFCSFLPLVFFKKSLPFLRLINGELAGSGFVVDKDVYFIGSSPQDDLRLSGYYGVRTAHVKIISYSQPKAFVLTDNSFDDAPSINFRTSQEQFLENKDIISLGGAKIQFFYQ